MANQKISELTEYVEADTTDDDVLPIVDSVNGVTKKIKLSELAKRPGSGTYYVSGNETTDGSWRFNVVSGNLLIQVRVSGSWLTKDTLTPDLT